MESQRGFTNPSLRRALHNCRMLLPNLAIIVGIGLILQNHSMAADITGGVLVAGGVLDL